MSEQPLEIKAEDIYSLLSDVHALTVENARILKRFEKIAADLEEKLPGTMAALSSNPLFKMLGIK